VSHICADDEYQSQVGATKLSHLFACKVIDVFSFHISTDFTGLSLRLRADIFEVTAHERIQHLLPNVTDIGGFVCNKEVFVVEIFLPGRKKT
jgi:hypothetical protein